MDFQLPTASMSPSKICLGTADYGSGVERTQSFRLLDAFLELGGTFIDTAHIYAAWLPGGEGQSERTLGEWLRMNKARDSVVLATKGGHPPLANMRQGRCSKADIEQDLTESLHRLRLDRVDLYWLHRDDPARPVEEIIETMDFLVRDGRIGAYGVSNWTWDRLAAGNRYARAQGLHAIAASQVGWALAERPLHTIDVEGMLCLDEVSRLRHAESGLPLAAYTAQAKGYFGSANVAWAQSGFNKRPPRGAAYDTPENRLRLKHAIELASAKGGTVNQIALAYILNQPFPTAAVIGTGDLDHLKEAMSAQRLTLTEAECEYLRG